MTSSLKLGKMLIVVLTSMVMASCGWSGPKSPQDWFDVTWAGLAGSDTLSFKGNASLVRENQIQAEGSLIFSGKLQNHQVLTLNAESPRPQSDQNLKTAATQKKGVTSTLQLKGKKWVVLNKPDSITTGVPHTLNRINPLAQLEEIHDTKAKTIGMESGAARGTKVLRIELDPGEAKQLLRRQLTEEMDQVLANWKIREQHLQIPTSRRQSLGREAGNVWGRGKKEMLDKLDTAKVTAVYHLTINKKTGLPKRLTLNNKITYPEVGSNGKPELLVSDCQFE